MGAVHAEMEHLLTESNMRNQGYFVFANTSMLLCWKHYMFMGRMCLRKRNNLDILCYLLSDNKCSVSALTAPSYQSKE